MRKNRIISLGALTVLAPSIWFSASQLSASNRTEATENAKGTVEPFSTSRQPLPANRLIDINQQEISTDELSHGRALLVFITTSCEPCVEEVKIITRLREVSPPNLRIYGISFERPAQVATFVKEFDLKFDILIDRNAQLVRSLDIHHFPSAYLVENGIITKVWRGVTRDEAALHRELNLE